MLQLRYTYKYTQTHIDSNNFNYRYIADDGGLYMGKYSCKRKREREKTYCGGDLMYITGEEKVPMVGSMSIR